MKKKTPFFSNPDNNNTTSISSLRQRARQRQLQQPEPRQLPTPPPHSTTIIMRNVIIGIVLFLGILFLVWFGMVKEHAGFLYDSLTTTPTTNSLRPLNTVDLSSLERKISQLEAKAQENEAFRIAIQTNLKQTPSSISETIESKVQSAVDLQFKLLRQELESALTKSNKGKAKQDDNTKQLLATIARLETMVHNLERTNKFIDDFTSCSNYLSHEVDSVSFPAANSAKKEYEFVRIGVSDFCNTGSTDVSVFFTLQSTAQGVNDCLDTVLSSVAVRFGLEEAGAAQETNAQMVGCFQDERRRSWRYFAARFSSLVPEQKYFYALEADGSNSEMRYFYAPPLAGASSETDIVFMGDTHRDGLQQVLRDVTKVTDYHDLVIHVGDGTYGTNNGDCYGKQHTREATSPCGWACSGTECDGAGRMKASVLDSIRLWTKDFDALVQGRMAWMTTMGNHDNDLQWFLSMRPTCASALPGVHVDDLAYSTNEALDVFAHSTLSMKEIYAQALDYMKSPHFYSFDYGKVHFLSLGSEDNPMNAYESWNGEPLSPELVKRFELHYGKQSKQYKWMIKDLSSIDRKLLPWLVVYTHRPLYSTANHHPNCQPGGDWFVCMFRDTYEPVFRQFGVDLVVSGHSHHYSRSHPMYGGKVDLLRGITHVVVGVGGFEVTGNNFQQADWVASRQGTEFGYVRMVVKNSTHAHWQHKLSGSNRVFDDAWLVRRL